MSARIRIFTAVLVLWCAAPASGGEGTPAVIVHANGACTSCEVVSSATTQMKLGSEHKTHLKPLPPRAVSLCPGGCFGFFPTQWRSWEEACGIPSTTPPVPGYIPTFPPSSDVIPGKSGRDPRFIVPTRPTIAPLHIPASRIN